MKKVRHKEIEKAIEIIDEMSMDPKEWELYESRRQATIAYNMEIAAVKNEGIKQGIKEGKNEEKEEIAKKMLTEKMPLELISKITGLREEEIKKLK